MEIDEFVLDRAAEMEAMARHVLAQCQEARLAVAEYRERAWAAPDSLRGLAGTDEPVPDALREAAARDFDHADYRQEWRPLTAATPSRSTSSTESGSSNG